MSAREDTDRQRRPQVVEYDRFGFNGHFEPIANSDNGHRSSADLRNAFEPPQKSSTR